MGVNDSELVVALAKPKGKQKTFDAIQYVERLAIYLAGRAGFVGHEVEDIAQETLVDLLKGLRKRRRAGPIENEEYFVRDLIRKRILDALDRRCTQKAKLVRAWSCIPDSSQGDIEETLVEAREANVSDPHQEPEHLDLVQRVREVVAELPRQLKKLCELLVAEDDKGRRLSNTKIAKRLRTSRPQLKLLMQRLQQKFIAAGFGDFTKKIVPKTTPVPAVTMGEACVPAPELIEHQSQLRSNRRVMATNCSRSSFRAPALSVSANC